MAEVVLGTARCVGGIQVYRDGRDCAGGIQVCRGYSGVLGTPGPNEMQAPVLQLDQGVH